MKQKVRYIWDLLRKVIERVSIRRNGIAVKIPLGEKKKKHLSHWEKRK